MNEKRIQHVRRAWVARQLAAPSSWSSSLLSSFSFSQSARIFVISLAKSLLRLSHSSSRDLAGSHGQDQDNCGKRDTAKQSEMYLQSSASYFSVNWLPQHISWIASYPLIRALSVRFSVGLVLLLEHLREACEKRRT